MILIHWSPMDCFGLIDFDSLSLVSSCRLILSDSFYLWILDDWFWLTPSDWWCLVPIDRSRCISFWCICNKDSISMDSFWLSHIEINSEGFIQIGSYWFAQSIDAFSLVDSDWLVLIDWSWLIDSDESFGLIRSDRLRLMDWSELLIQAIFQFFFQTRFLITFNFSPHSRLINYYIFNHQLIHCKYMLNTCFL